MNINDIYSSDFLKASDLGGQERSATIESVTMEEVGQNKDRKLAVKFQGKDKRLLLNKTNAQMLAEAYSPETAGWVGKAVVLFTTKVSYNGQMVDGLRVRAAPQPATETFAGPNAAAAEEVPADPNHPANAGSAPPAHF